MVDIPNDTPKLIDLSFMASLECDLQCPHCMYGSSPTTTNRLDYERVVEWVETIDWGCINATGFYGGEPSILLDWYSKFIDLVPVEIPKFIITNGTWSRSPENIQTFLEFVQGRSLQVVVSGTKWHRPYQNLEVLGDLSERGLITWKGEEKEIIPMGAASAWKPKSCSQICQEWTKPWRIALHPTRDVIFQSCDGSYPHLQTLDQPFSEVVPNITGLVTRASTYSESQCLPYQLKSY